MASIKQSLKNVYKALSGGTDSNAKTIPDIINDISTVASSGGGGERFDVNVTMEYNTDHYDVISFDKTLDEMFDAYNEGKNIIAHTNIMGVHHMLNAIDVEADGASFSSCDIMGDQVNIFYLSLGTNSQKTAFYWKIIK